MRRLVLVLIGLAASLAIGVSLASAGTRKHHACKMRDNQHNWEVVIGHAATPKAARRIVLRASSKGLHATMERDGCSKRLEVEIGVRTKAQAEATMKQAQSDGFKSVTIERS